MNVIDKARELGRAIQQDERFVRYAKARLANDSDSELQDAIGQFNIVRMELDREISSDDKDDLKVQELNEKLRKVYSDIMSAPAMVEYNTAKAELDSMVNDVNVIISKCIDGEDPDTCDTNAACTGSCESCGGCH
ncbi:MAG: YlbF family regulator [Acutalibacteraceae bacterium]|nr:YlbF family regulator [Acutalibacteraceae bacterium]